MRKIVEFYKNLNKHKKIAFWICIGLIFLSIIRIPITSARRRQTPSLKYFIKNLKSEKKDEKIDAIFSCGKLKIKNALYEIEEIFQKDPDIKVKRYCAWSIGRIDFNRLLTYLDNSDKIIKEITFETILKFDPKNIDYLINRFEKEDTETKLKILSYMASPTYQEKLLKILEDEKEELDVRKKALEILREKGNWEEIETSLWALYYGEKDYDMKNLIYQVIKDFQKRGKK
ncbi:MAG: hypothetical protein NC915_02350 [Candidatus Omnitrophica bacterium]|nr:hypothetical protein [Candidatus Omnitrophota bacterium]